jgi:hypothetical protein
MAGQDWAMLFGLALVFGSAFFLVRSWRWALRAADRWR